MQNNESVLTLSISHNLFLTKEERYSLINGYKIKIIGISVPVWFYKGNTSEPAIEVFCDYFLTNDKDDYPISTCKSGYRINLPQRTLEKTSSTISDEDWRKLSVNEKSNLLINKKTEISADNLKDISDGGCEHLFFKKFNKIEKENKLMHIMHIIEIISIENLIKSLA